MKNCNPRFAERDYLLLIAYSVMGIHNEILRAYWAYYF